MKYGKALPARSRDGGAYPVYGSNGIVGNHSAYLAEGPTVIVGRKGSVGEVCYSAVPCFPIDTTYYAEEFEVTHSKFIYYLLRNLDLASLNKSTAIPGLNRQDAYDLEIPLPPLAEQKRIAQKLDALLAQVDTLKARIDAIPALLKRFRESVLTAATNGNLTEDWRTQMGSCENWTKVELADVAREFSYGSAAKSTKQGLVPVLRMGNIQNRLLDWKDLVFTSDLDEIKKYGLKDGDVLFNRTNSPELVGKTAVFKGNRDAIYAGYLIKVKCSARLLPDYLNYCLGSPLGRAYCWKVKSDGVSQSNINAKKLAAFTFDLPSVEEQTEIVRRVEQLFAYADQLEAKVAAAQKRINALTQSLLAKAFRGELVPQDPTDEPASVLLERIRTQRAAAPKPKRGRKAATS
ncbi:restriction endonuclease subunit S [Xanthomonas oryzae]|uniref:restriction endonuclease subunit S n=1 Tax=Xanthomonas oryzae TaxID=347 RepID=UPI001F4C894B|nr:restriction endonuclease subunit S [Xanthomonas oryzae]UNE61988.1 restriction endonuclease subunit S [Xanthomonas oryzae]